MMQKSDIRIKEKTMDRRKMRYKEEIQHVNSHYYEEVLINGGVLEDDDLDESTRCYFQKRFDHSAQMVRTTLPLQNLTVPAPFTINISELPGVNTEPMTKEGHVKNLDVIIADREQLLAGIRNLYKGTATETEKRVRKEIEGLLWCRDGIRDEHILL